MSSWFCGGGVSEEPENPFLPSSGNITTVTIDRNQ